jgi:hypothetical protein
VLGFGQVLVQDLAWMDRRHQHRLLGDQTAFNKERELEIREPALPACGEERGKRQLNPWKTHRSIASSGICSGGWTNNSPR